MDVRPFFGIFWNSPAGFFSVRYCTKAPLGNATRQSDVQGAVSLQPPSGNATSQGEIRGLRKAVAADDNSDDDGCIELIYLHLVGGGFCSR